MLSVIERLPGVPWAWGYARQSDPLAIERGEGLPNQNARMKAYFEAFLKPRGVAEFKFVPDESAVSARTNPFMLRHAGRTLLTEMQAGDHFIVDKLDRLWRSNDDFVDLTREFRRRQITLHICNLMGIGAVELGTPMGDFVVAMMVNLAQLESAQVADRTAAAKRSRRARGLYHHQLTRPPLGCRVVGQVKRNHLGKVVKNEARLVWDDSYRRFMAEVVRLADVERMSAHQIEKIARKHFTAMLGRDWWIELYNKKQISHLMIATHYWREKQYQVLPPFDPNRIEFKHFCSPANEFRDIGPAEPKIPNPFPFLDGRPIPKTAEEFYKIAG